mgnify:FL=1
MIKKVLTSEQLNALKKEIYSNAVAHGFHDEKLTVEHYLGLVLSEIGEAINADRNPNAPTVTEATLEQAQLLAGQSIGHVAFVEFFKSNIKGSVIEELADVAIRILDLAGKLEIKFDDDLEANDLVFDTTFPDRLFGFAMTLDNLDYEFTDEDDFLECLEEITSIAMHFTNLNLWKVVGLKMIYNKTRPVLNGKKY